MSVSKKKPALFETPEGVAIEEALKAMAKDAYYNTESGYSANTTLYPDNSRSFVEKHKDYLRNHPSTDPKLYVANLRLMTRLR